jgi:predicted dehydrogenase
MDADRPRLGFLGAGWIGLDRMEAVIEAGVGEVVAIADTAPDMVREAARRAPGALLADDLDAVLDAGVDAVVIATPSAMHAAQAIRALQRGVAVFCQKPLGRTAAEVAAVLSAARRADRPLGVDFSYRCTEAFRAVKQRIDAGEIGRVFAADLVFHNAYGPDKPWFYDPAQSGGGCVMDLGVHLVDLALWTLGFPEVTGVTSRLHAGGALLPPAPGVVEDYATASIHTETGASLRLACSWRLHAGIDAEIEAVFHGTEGGLAFRNVGGSFYDFEALLFRGTRREALVAPPDRWGGRALVEWVRGLSAAPGFDASAEEYLRSAAVLDAIYGR